MLTKWTVSILFALAILTAPGPSRAADADPSKAGKKEQSEGDGTTVRMSKKKYDPPTIKIKVGQAVTWVNEDDHDHTVVADDGSFESENIRAGEKFTHTFKKAGKFKYDCTYHPRMKGVVIVEG